MPWYKTGTVSVVQNSNAVIGASTAFLANGRDGDAFRGPDGGWYEVVNIASDSSMSISPNYQGATKSAGTYALAPMQGYVKDSADALRALVSQFGDQLAALTDSNGLPEGSINKYFTDARVRGTLLMGLAVTDLSAVVATDAVLPAIGKLQAQAARLSTGYLDGLRPVWGGSGSVSVSPGAAHVPGLNRVLVASNQLTYSFTPGSLAANTFYYLYLFENAGAAALELSTTIPVVYANGIARQKTGDSTRRFVATIRSGPGGSLLQFALDGDLMTYIASTNVAPFRMLSSGAAVTATTVNLSSVVPASSASAFLSVYNASAVGGPVVYLSTVSGAGYTMRGFDPAGRSATRFPTENGQISYFNTASGGNTFIDVLGYSLER